MKNVEDINCGLTSHLHFHYKIMNLYVYQVPATRNIDARANCFIQSNQVEFRNQD